MVLPSQRVQLPSFPRTFPGITTRMPHLWELYANTALYAMPSCDSLDVLGCVRSCRCLASMWRQQWDRSVQCSVVSRCLSRCLGLIPVELTRQAPGGAPVDFIGESHWLNTLGISFPYRIVAYAHLARDDTETVLRQQVTTCCSLWCLRASRRVCVDFHCASWFDGFPALVILCPALCAVAPRLQFPTWSASG